MSNNDTDIDMEEQALAWLEEDLAAARKWPSFGQLEIGVKLRAMLNPDAYTSTYAAALLRIVELEERLGRQEVGA